MIPFSEHDISFGPRDCLLWKPGMQTSPHACSLAWVTLPDLPRFWLAVGWPLSWQSPLRHSPCVHRVDPLGTIKAAELALLQTHLHKLWMKDNAFFTNLTTVHWEKNIGQDWEMQAQFLWAEHRVTTVMFREMEQKMGQGTASSQKLATWQPRALQAVWQRKTIFKWTYLTNTLYFL